MGGEQAIRALPAILIQMKRTRYSATEVHGAITTAKENRKQKKLFSADAEVQREQWKKVESEVLKQLFVPKQFEKRHEKNATRPLDQAGNTRPNGSGRDEKGGRFASRK